ncbi:hypothetical protein EB796_017012 [Bugula neritina]|uniref:F-box domain-containing protein n=1 Tax=Bugula neritina TaxID=10212 RepID=A0A7J7JEN2_BUGNE|nr:hypothetical protein EB796_017012 [Bugula neritina]
MLGMQNDNNECRPQLVSRHSSNLPANHRNNTKKQALSRRSRSASPCVKKYSVYTVILNRTKNDPTSSMITPKSPQLPSIRKSSSHLATKSLKASRHLANTKQRSQCFNDFKKNAILYKSVWENVSSVKSNGPFVTDVNSNFSCLPYTKASYSSSRQEWCPVQLETQTYHTGDGTITFDHLPNECILKIFSYLNQLERGRCMFVCWKWYAVAQTPMIWSHINFREFNLCYGHGPNTELPQYLDAEHTAQGVTQVNTKTQCTKSCYGKYITRIERYILFLIDIQPKIKRLEFSFDLLKDGWVEIIKHLIRHTTVSEIEYVDMDWQDTPVKPQHLFSDSYVRLQDIMYETRRRHRSFTQFLEEFIELIPHVKTLVMPFHWPSVKAAKLVFPSTNLVNLVLKKSTVLQIPSQEVFDELSKITDLERLLIEVWMPNVSNDFLASYCIKSRSLKYLDLSQCKNFNIKSVDLPSLEVLIVGRPPTLCSNQRIRQSTVPCLCKVIRRGAPHLRRINCHILEEMTVNEIDILLKSICPICKPRHH